MRVRANSVFEGIVYHCALAERGDPARPRLEVDAILRPGDADADAGPLLLPVSEYMVLVGDVEAARRAIADLDRRGRIAERMGVRYISFPMWERITDDHDDETGPD